MTCLVERVLFRLDIRLFTREDVLTRSGQTVYLNRRSPVAKGIRLIDDYLGEVVLGAREGGDTIGPDQAVSVMDAIRTYTINGAYASFDEDWLVSIETGKLADMIVLSDDITTVEPEKIRDVKVLATIMDGRTVFREL